MQIKIALHWFCSGHWQMFNRLIITPAGKRVDKQALLPLLAGVKSAINFGRVI